MANLGKEAAELHAFMCESPLFGYSWSPRWGEDGEYITFTSSSGRRYTIKTGSYDCSSSSITSWDEVLKGTPYEGVLDGATYTGNMRKVFTDSSLFEWKPMSFIAQPGDLYLNEANHVAMCVSSEPDLLSEFSINENGGCYGGQVGDQTGRESSVHAYYDYPWDGILHYNGKADTDAPEVEPEQPQTMRKLRVYSGSQWWPWHYKGGCEDNSGDDYAGVRGQAIYGVEAINCGTLAVERADGTMDDGQVKDSPITGIHLTDADYQAHWMGAMPTWGKIEHNDDDDGAGRDRQHPLDMIRLLS